MKLIKELPYKSILDNEQLDLAIYESDKNICEYNDPQQITQFDGPGECDPSGLYYGDTDSNSAHFCARHFYQLVANGDGKTNYKLSA